MKVALLALLALKKGKSMLEYTEATYKCVGYYDIEKVIDKVFEFKKSNGYELMPSEEVGSSQYAPYIIKRVDGEVDPYEADDIEEALKSKDPSKLQFRLTAAMNYCCLKGEIEAGEYLISVSW